MVFLLTYLLASLKRESVLCLLFASVSRCICRCGVEYRVYHQC